MAHPTLEAWHRLVRAQSAAGLDELLAEDVALFSPMVHAPQVGREVVLQYLSAVFRVFLPGNFRYRRELAGPRDALLEFEVEVDGVTVNGIDMLRWNNEGRIVEFKVMVRPLQALKVLHQQIAAEIESSRRG